ncbi:MAG: signal peptidase I [Candidatus Saccharimonadales bacterium]
MQPDETPSSEIDNRPVAGSGTPDTDSTHKLRETLSTIGLLLLAPLIAICLTLFVFQSYQVDGQSMEKTLHNNDRLIVWKLPRTWARITGHQYVPSRGDVVILNESGLTNYGSPEDAKQLVKRVIGLPGDHVVVRNNVITIYNAEHPEGFEPDKTLPYGANNAIPITPNDIDVKLSSTQLFVCGDNRLNSLDSRTFGAVETSQIVGKTVARIMPLTDIKRF